MPGANSTPWQLEGRDPRSARGGFEDLVCVQNKTVVTNAFKGEDLNGYMPICRQYCVPVRYNFRHEDMAWMRYTPRAKMLALDKIFPEGIRLPDYFCGKNIVHLPTAKCHIYTQTTGAMKNAFGGLLSHHRHYTHTWIHETLVDLLAIQKEIHSGIFAFMDATTAGNGPGPRIVKPEVKNVILASADQVAIDAVAAKLMGFDPLSIPYIRLAHEAGLGCGDMRGIDIVGDDVSGENWHFAVGQSFHRFLAWLGWFGPLKFMQNLIFHTPIVAIPTLVSEVEHDYIHWPLKEKHVYEHWRETTEWGKLFAQYQKKGVMGK